MKLRFRSLFIFLFVLVLSNMVNATDTKIKESLNLPQEETVKMHDFSLKVPKGWSYQRSETYSNEKMIKEWITIAPSEDITHSLTNIGIFSVVAEYFPIKDKLEDNKAIGAKMFPRTVNGSKWEFVAFNKAAESGAVVEHLDGLSIIKKNGVSFSSVIPKLDSQYKSHKQAIDQILDSITLGH